MGYVDDFNVKFRVYDLQLYENSTWALIVRPEQITLGAMVAFHKGYACSFSDVKDPSQAGSDYLDVLCKAESVARRFGADKVNYLSLMMVDANLHTHIIPRYQAAVDFSGKKWADADWPKPVVMRGAPTEESALLSVLDFAKKAVDDCQNSNEIR